MVRAIAFIVILAIPSTLVTSEYQLLRNVCAEADTEVKTAQEAIRAVRGYRGTWPFDGPLTIRSSEIFQSDGFGPKGGWRAKEWRTFWIIHGYTVDFDLFEPQVEIKCDVLECGAVTNCGTLGDFKSP